MKTHILTSGKTLAVNLHNENFTFIYFCEAIELIRQNMPNYQVECVKFDNSFEL